MSDLDRNLGSSGPFDFPLPGTPIDELPGWAKPDFNPLDQNGYTIAPAGSPQAAAGGGAAPTVSHLVLVGSANIVVPAGVAGVVAWEGDGGLLILNYAAAVAGGQPPLGPAGALRIRMASFAITDTTAAPAGQISLLAATLKILGTANSWTRALETGGDLPRQGASFLAQLPSLWDLRAGDLDQSGPSNAFASAALELAIQNFDQANNHDLTVTWAYAIDIFANVS